ncbi:MAG: DUF1573 domain-containing protein [Dysgonamonadaceae bacterium]|jgi:hypothetical protein|nr:DUF1573 domain-containing protein [Dysgonamonadaceae bacterium]
MKKVFFLAIVCLFNLAIYAQTTGAPIVFNVTTHDFGEIQQGVPQKAVFEFTNTGTDPVSIQNVQPSCNCTTPEWTKEPVEAGQKGSVQVTFSAEKAGAFNKSLKVIVSGKAEPIVLYLKGTVKGAEK